MGVKERSRTEKGAVEEAAAAPSFLDRLNAYGEKHARVIIIASTVVAIVTILIVLDVLNRRAKVPRAERERVKATDSKSLKELAEKYRDVREVAPLIQLQLAHALYDEDKLEEAKQAYELFLQRWPAHPLSVTALAGKNRIVEAEEFQSRSRLALLHRDELSIHPLRSESLAQGTASLEARWRELRDKADEESKASAAALRAELDRRAASPLAASPPKLPNPVLVFRVKPAAATGSEPPTPRSFRVELFEDEAPNSVASLVELVRAKYFDGLKFDVSAEHLSVVEKADTPNKERLAYERTSRYGSVGSLVLVREPDGSDNLAARFILLLKDRPAESETVVGVVSEALPNAREVKADDVIESVTVEHLRDHEYRPVRLPPK